jgi:hypothetical protein
MAEVYLRNDKAVGSQMTWIGYTAGPPEGGQWYPDLQAWVVVEEPEDIQRPSGPREFIPKVNYPGREC